MNTKKILFFLLSTSLINSIFSGDDFFALHLPDNLKKQIANIQNYVNNRLKTANLKLSKSPPGNLHITLKQIGNLDDSERASITPEIKNFAQKQSKFNINNAIENATLKISGNLVLLILAENQNLTNLAKSIEQKLKELKNKNIISVFKKRMDFPKGGHVTIGAIMDNKDQLLKSTTKYKPYFQKITNSFINSLKVNFDVDSFVLLKSNRPATPRIYFEKRKFELGIRTQRHDIKHLSNQLSSLNANLMYLNQNIN